MDTPLKAIEVTGMVDDQGQLHLDHPVPLPHSARARVILLFPEEAELTDQHWLRASVTNPAFDFLHDPAEDIYTPGDGKPFHDER